MKNIITSFLIVFCTVILLTSCGVSRYTAPPFTDVERIMKLKSGSSVENVNSTLGIKPYDIVHSYETGSKILIFNYRIKDRNMTLASRSANRIIHSEEAQREGDIWYNTNHKEIFLLFKHDTLSGIYGERMFSEGSYLEMIHDRLAFDEQTTLPENSNISSIKNNRDYLFLQNVYEERNAVKEKAILQADEEIEKRRKLLMKIGIAVLIIGGFIF